MNFNIMNFRLILKILIFIFFAVIVSQNRNLSFNSSTSTHHGYLSSHGITIAKNLGIENNFLMFHKISKEEDKTEYEAYNRFPITSFILLKTVILLAGDNLELQILYSRYLMLIFYISSIILSYYILFMLFGKRKLAFFVVMISFSSWYLQYYSDMIFNDIPTFFGFILAFYGIVKYEQKKSNFKNLLIKFLIAIALGWQVYALIMTYISYRVFISGGGKRIYTSLKIAVLCSIFGIMILGGQLLNEAVMTQKRFAEIETVKSILNRTGVSTNSEFKNAHQELLSFFPGIKTLAGRLVKTIIPHPITNSELITVIVFIFLILLILYGLLKTKVLIENKQSFILLTIMSVGGVLWTLLMWNFTIFHNFQSIFHIGTLFLIYSFVYLFLVNRFSNIHKVILPVSILFFLYSSYNINQIKIEDSEKNSPTKDMQKIMNLLPSTQIKIYIDDSQANVCGAAHSCAFYLSNHYLYVEENASDCDYFISKNKNFSKKILTPSNKEVFLFKN